MTPARVQLARLTVRQYQNAVADLLGNFRESKEIGAERGLKADYYNARNFRNDKKVFDRVDRRVEFDVEDSSAGVAETVRRIAITGFHALWEGRTAMLGELGGGDGKGAGATFDR